jgi:RNA polymerase sigma factor (sigma-70 family)
VDVTSARPLDVLVHRAAQGELAAWETLVQRFSVLVSSVIRSFDLTDVDAADVNQTTWMRLAEHLDRIEQPERLGAWLVTTARRECWRQARSSRRHVLVGESSELEHSDRSSAPPDAMLLARERDAAVARVLVLLPERSRTLLSMLVSDPPVPYEEISRSLDMPVGSIGPTRARLLATLRKHAESAGIDLSP